MKKIITFFSLLFPKFRQVKLKLKMNNTKIKIFLGDMSVMKIIHISEEEVCMYEYITLKQ